MCPITQAIREKQASEHTIHVDQLGGSRDRNMESNTDQLLGYFPCTPHPPDDGWEREHRGKMYNFDESRRILPLVLRRRYARTHLTFLKRSPTPSRMIIFPFPHQATVSLLTWLRPRHSRSLSSTATAASITMSYPTRLFEPPVLAIEALGTRGSEEPPLLERGHRRLMEHHLCRDHRSTFTAWSTVLTCCR